MRSLPCRLASLLRIFGCVGMMWLASTAMTALAQETPPAAPPVIISKPLYLEWGITVVMIGLVLFAVCRKSNRT